MQGSIVGVWTLQTFHSEIVATKQRSEPFGPAPRGTLILHADGRMAVLMTPGREEARGAALDTASMPSIIAYSGRYRLEAPDRLVTAVDVASFAAWVGTEQVRSYALDGDRLDLFTPPGRMPGPGGGDEVIAIGVLSWARDT